LAKKEAAECSSQILGVILNLQIEKTDWDIRLLKTIVTMNFSFFNVVLYYFHSIKI